MDKRPLIRKSATVCIILLFVGILIIPATAVPLHKTENIISHLGGFFGLNSNIEISWDANQTEDPIIPRGEIRTVELDIGFWVTWGVCGRLINYLLRYELVKITVSVIDNPGWCVAIVSQGTVSPTIPPKENIHDIVHTQLSVAVADDAPAFELCPVTIETTIEPLHGPFGFLTVMAGATKVVNVTFTVGYKPLIQPFFPQTNIIEAPPLVQVELPIGIQNLGNGRTTVVNEVVDYPDGWIVSLPAQLVLEVGDYKEMNLSIVAPSNFSGEAFITVSFTPHSSDNYSLVGTTTYATFLAYYNPPS